MFKLCLIFQCAKQKKIQKIIENIWTDHLKEILKSIWCDFILQTSKKWAYVQNSLPFICHKRNLYFV